LAIFLTRNMLGRRRRNAAAHCFGVASAFIATAGTTALNILQRQKVTLVEASDKEKEHATKFPQALDKVCEVDMQQEELFRMLSEGIDTHGYGWVELTDMNLNSQGDGMQKRRPRIPRMRKPKMSRLNMPRSKRLSS
jgi:hypothetical protein